MAEGKRPGGLTALAVLNFVFAGLGLLALLALFALVGAAQHAITLAKESGAEVHDTVSAGTIYIAIVFGLVRMVTMLIAGIGYLGQKKFLGRTMGNVYAILALADTAIGLALIHSGFGIGTIIGLVYPVLTLALINGTFKDDLVN